MTDWLVEAARLIALQVVSLVVAFVIAAAIIRDYNRRHPSVSRFIGVCAYCGWTGESRGALLSHTYECKHHPMSQLRSDNTRLMFLNDKLREDRAELLQKLPE